ncbi:MAG: hypothetical protein WC480_02825 [Patescibacteria group bacterium]
MYLTIHTAIGAAIGQNVASPWLAFILGIFSHYLVDAIPHGDKKMVRGLEQHDGLLKFIKVVAIDNSFMIATILILLSSSQPNYWSVVAGIVGAIIPDYSQAIGWLLPKTFFRHFYNLHSIFHNKITKFDFSPYIAFWITEVPLFIISLLLFYLK